MEDIHEILQQTFLLFLLVGSVLGLVMGILLLLQPGALERLNQYFSRWISVAWMREWLERLRDTDIERFSHRHHRIAGGILLAYAAIGLYAFLSTRIYWASTGAAGWLPAVLTNLFLVSLALAAVVGWILLLYPGALYNLERIANHWTSSDNILGWLEDERPPIDQYILRHRLSTGLLIIVGSLYVLIAVGYFLTTGSLL
jgi:hypothetical protein